MAQQSQQLHSQQAALEQMRAQIGHLSQALQNNNNSANAANASNAAKHMKPLAPNPFTGHTGSNADQWITELERYFTASRSQPDSSSVVFASTYLRDAASVWFTAQFPQGASIPQWDEFKRVFLERFRPFAADRIARVNLRELRHRSNVTGYSDAFLKCVQLIPDMHMADQVDAYLNGLQRHVAVEVDRLDPKTLSEAINLAQREELRQSSQGRRGQAPLFYNNRDRRNITPRPPYQNTDSNRMDLSALMFSQQGPPQESFHSYENQYSVHPYGPPPQAAAAYGYHSSQSVHQQAGDMQQQYHGDSMNLHAMYQRPSAPYRNGGGRSGNRAPEMPREEFDRCVKNRLCFRCKRPDHLSRNCPLAQQGNGQPKN